ncbi:MAG: hypothetical protein A3F67_03485 [Verrucomicrobia bacterium RIFCSPHIGHO2_12_FULL_41_10]|nr:MAG: hypothetical protein A3F67_03485 [Verrucomicrobia bacterium RIFCSPHIGHO2_12_FULL_41_10]HLB34870.1 SUMF1/EgtB/PvdO family nonheme iron enzyme [Chthoniobacterales bacterium]
MTFRKSALLLSLLIVFLSLSTLRADPPSPSPTPTADDAIAPLSLPLTIDLIPMEDFSIARKCISVKEYCAFLNAVASTGDPYHLYKPQMSMDSRTACIICTRIGDLYSYSVIQGTRTLPTRVDEKGRPVAIPIGDLPITWVTVCDAARFCNWMHFGQPVGAEGPGITESDSTHSGAYIEGYIPTYTNKLITRQNVMDKVITPQAGAQWRLPTQDEWNQFEFLHSNDDGDKDYWQWIDAWKKFSGYLAKSGLHLENHFYYPETPMINFGIRLVKT